MTIKIKLSTHKDLITLWKLLNKIDNNKEINVMTTMKGNELWIYLKT